MIGINEEKLKEMIFEDSYAYNELESYKQEYGEDNPSVKELEKAVTWYYNIASDKPSDMALNFLKNLIERKTFTPIYDREEDWIPTEDLPDTVWSHKRRSSVVRIKKPEGEGYLYSDIDSFDVYDQDMHRVDFAIAQKLSLGLNEIEFPYMFTGKNIMLVVLSGDVAKIVSLRTPHGNTISINKCVRIGDGLEEITEEEFVREMAVNAGKEAIKKNDTSQN